VLAEAGFSELSLENAWTDCFRVADLVGPNLIVNAGAELAERSEPNLHIASGF
jgi:hypothetical protein